MGEVDHFRPKSKYPELVYQWSNWIFSCHDCNLTKREKWPRGGYFDPCATSPRARPENYFTFDLLTGHILPSDDLSPRQRLKALQMIGDLKLNAHHRLRNRRGWLSLVELVIDKRFDAELLEFVRIVCSRAERLSSIIRVMVDQRGLSFE